MILQPGQVLLFRCAPGIQAAGSMSLWTCQIHIILQLSACVLPHAHQMQPSCLQGSAEQDGL